MNKLTTKMHLFKEFNDVVNNDFFLINMGYNNYHLNKSIKTTRQYNFHTLHIVLNGSGVLHFNGTIHKLKAHQMFYLPPHQDLIHHPDQDNVWDYIWFGFDGKNSSTYASLMDMDINSPVTECIDFKQTFLQLQILFKKLEENKIVGYYDALSTFYKILDINSNEQSDKSESMVEHAVKYIDANFSKHNFNVDKMCQELSISHSYLCKIFKEQHQISIKDYLIICRMHTATKLLKNTNLTIKEISYDVGFNDENHFAKSFKKYWNVTCSQYRENNKIN